MFCVKPTVGNSRDCKKGYSSVRHAHADYVSEKRTCVKQNEVSWFNYILRLHQVVMPYQYLQRLIFKSLLKRTRILVHIKVKRVSSSYNKPWRPREGVEIYLYPFFNLGARWDEWSTLLSSYLNPGKETRYPMCRKVGGTQGRYGQVRKISPLIGIRTADRAARSELL